MLTAFPSDSYVEPSLSSGDHLYIDVAEVELLDFGVHWLAQLVGKMLSHTEICRQGQQA